MSIILNPGVTREKLHELTIEMPYKWKVQTAKQWGCECVAYVDARQVMDMLDEALGPENWQDHYREVAGNVYCDLKIKVDGEWVTKSDCGSESSFEKEKGQASDAFKRAAVKWGIGRFLYRLPMVKTKSVETGKDRNNNPKYGPADQDGRPIKSWDLNDYCQAKVQSKARNYTPKTEPLVSDQAKSGLLAQAKRCQIEQENWNAMVTGRGIKWSVMTQAQFNQLKKHLDSIEASLKAEAVIGGDAA
jgi:hypothetical protein